MASLTWLYVAALALPLGCTLERGVNDVGGRPERFIHVPAVSADRFLGDPFLGNWGPGPDYLANDWTVRFARDHRMSVSGPGMDARGTFSVQGLEAIVTYRIRNGQVPEDPRLARAVFTLSADTHELSFSTGLPNDPPVRLLRR
jgi:hypothetical protein